MKDVYIYMKCVDCNLPFKEGDEGNWLQVNKYKDFKRVCEPCYMKSRMSTTTEAVIIGKEYVNEPKSNL